MLDIMRYYIYNYLITIFIVSKNLIFQNKGVSIMYEKVKALLVDELSINEADITPEAELVSDLGINSLELADLVLLCEEKFDIEIGDDIIHKFITVGDVSEYLAEVTK